MRLIALLGERDGHSGIYPFDSHRAAMHLYPLKLYSFSDGIFVIAADGVPGAVGGRVVAIDGVPIDDVVARVWPLIPRDNEWTRRSHLPGWLTSAEVLNGAGVTSAGRRATFKLVSPTGT